MHKLRHQDKIWGWDSEKHQIKIWYDENKWKYNGKSVKSLKRNIYSINGVIYRQGCRIDKGIVV